MFRRFFEQTLMRLFFTVLASVFLNRPRATLAAGGLAGAEEVELQPASARLARSVKDSRGRVRMQVTVMEHSRRSLSLESPSGVANQAQAMSCCGLR